MIIRVFIFTGFSLTFNADLDARNKKAAAEREERLAGTAQMEARKAALAAKGG